MNLNFVSVVCKILTILSVSSCGDFQWYILEGVHFVYINMALLREVTLASEWHTDEPIYTGGIDT